MTTWIDVRSDTVTQLTEAMRRAMAEAEVGDDVYQDDPTIQQLETRAAELVGKEKSLFVPSGTMGNQIAVMATTTPSDEIIVGTSYHIVVNEVGGLARLAGVNCALVDAPDNYIRAEDIKRLVRQDDIHLPHTSLVCMENALGDGTVVPLEIMQASYRQVKECGLAVHTDGARLFNAAAALGVDGKVLAACTDSVMFCLSKGLCAPVGSMLCGSAEFIEKARRYRKMLGGGMRQAGVLAAAGLVALEMIDRLREDHANAVHLATLLAAIPGIRVDLAKVQINMVYWTHDIAGFDDADFIAFLQKRGIKASRAKPGDKYRFVTNNGVGRTDVEQIAAAVCEFVATQC